MPSLSQDAGSSPCMHIGVAGDAVFPLLPEQMSSLSLLKGASPANGEQPPSELADLELSPNAAEQGRGSNSSSSSSLNCGASTCSFGSSGSDAGAELGTPRHELGLGTNPGPASAQALPSEPGVKARGQGSFAPARRQSTEGAPSANGRRAPDIAFGGGAGWAGRVRYPAQHGGAEGGGRTAEAWGGIPEGGVSERSGGDPGEGWRGHRGGQREKGEGQRGGNAQTPPSRAHGRSRGRHQRLSRRRSTSSGLGGLGGSRNENDGFAASTEGSDSDGAPHAALRGPRGSMGFSRPRHRELLGLSRRCSESTLAEPEVDVAGGTEGEVSGGQGAAGPKAESGEGIEPKRRGFRRRSSSYAASRRGTQAWGMEHCGGASAAPAAPDLQYQLLQHQLHLQHQQYQQHPQHPQYPHHQHRHLPRHLSEQSLGECHAPCCGVPGAGGPQSCGAHLAALRQQSLPLSSSVTGGNSSTESLTFLSSHPPHVLVQAPLPNQAAWHAPGLSHASLSCHPGTSTYGNDSHGPVPCSCHAPYSSSAEGPVHFHSVHPRSQPGHVLVKLDTWRAPLHGHQDELEDFVSTDPRARMGGDWPGSVPPSPRPVAEARLSHGAPVACRCSQCVHEWQQQHQHQHQNHQHQHQHQNHQHQHQQRVQFAQSMLPWGGPPGADDSLAHGREVELASLGHRRSLGPADLKSLSIGSGAARLPRLSTGSFEVYQPGEASAGEGRRHVAAAPVERFEGGPRWEENPGLFADSRRAACCDKTGRGAPASTDLQKAEGLVYPGETSCGTPIGRTSAMSSSSSLDQPEAALPLLESPLGTFTRRVTGSSPPPPLPAGSLEPQLSPLNVSRGTGHRAMAMQDARDCNAVVNRSPSGGGLAAYPGLAGAPPVPPRRRASLSSLETAVSQQTQGGVGPTASLAEAWHEASPAAARTATTLGGTEDPALCAPSGSTLSNQSCIGQVYPWRAEGHHRGRRARRSLACSREAGTRSGRHGEAGMYPQVVLEGPLGKAEDVVALAGGPRHEAGTVNRDAQKGAMGGVSGAVAVVPRAGHLAAGLAQAASRGHQYPAPRPAAALAQLVAACGLHAQPQHLEPDTLSALLRSFGGRHGLQTGACSGCPLSLMLLSTWRPNGQLHNGRSTALVALAAPSLRTPPAGVPAGHAPGVPAPGSAGEALGTTLLCTDSATGGAIGRPAARRGGLRGLLLGVLEAFGVRRQEQGTLPQAQASTPQQLPLAAAVVPTLVPANRQGSAAAAAAPLAASGTMRGSVGAKEGDEKAVEMMMVLRPHTLADILESAAAVGAGLGVPEASTAALLSAQRARLRRIAAALASLPLSSRPSVGVVALSAVPPGPAGTGTAQPLFVPDQSWMHEAVALAGGRLVRPQLAMGHISGAGAAGTARAGPADVANVASRADVLLVLMEGPQAHMGKAARELLALPGFAASPAAQQQQLYICNAALLAPVGPAIVDGIEAIAHLLHPKALADSSRTLWAPPPATLYKLAADMATADVSTLASADVAVGHLFADLASVPASNL